jgi:cyclopropane-fatty-acyl-phospholipid synthase
MFAYLTTFCITYLCPYLPDFILKFVIKNELKGRIVSEQSKYTNLKNVDEVFKAKLNTYQNIAVATEEANDQHYMVDTNFFQLVMGDQLKYSCCFYKQDWESLSEAERNMLDMYIADLGLSTKVNLNVLDIGCGWGSFTLYAAKKFKNCNFVCFSNSSSQRRFIESKIEEFKLTNVKAVTGDINQLTSEMLDVNYKFDRAISIEMFEHMKRYDILFNKISQLLNDTGKLLVHVFVHDTLCYEFDTTSWMGRNFFTGGNMPSYDLLTKYEDASDLKLEKRRSINGKHYAKTSYEWVQNMDQNKDKIVTIFKDAYKHTPFSPIYWFYSWRIFFMACAGCFEYNDGKEWYVAHYLFKK